ncbi:MAG: hypothetical protein IT548_19240 [Alphaproteobacteria bacterium]|nr:hypothetical protein [Alphaproteobacteria bacterium]
MPEDKLPQMCGLAVCAIVVLGMDASPTVATAMGVFLGALAHFAMALVTKPRR